MSRDLEASRPVVLVTGASSGIGRMTAIKFASRGARVALLARRENRLSEVADEVSRAGGLPMVIVADVSNRFGVEHAVETVVKGWGRLDTLVNNAGFVVYGSVDECMVEDFERQISVNYLGAVYATKAALPVMREQGSGSIINVSSLNGVIHIPFNSAYNASKAALRAFSLTLRKELEGTRLSVSIISPGYTETEILKVMVKRGAIRKQVLFKALSPGEVADVIVGCADSPCRERLMPFQLRPLAFTYSIFPRAIEAYLRSLNHVSDYKNRLRLFLKLNKE